MKQWACQNSLPIDFCFIDGGHDYWTVKHDFLSSLRIAGTACRFLFDDYIERKDYGVSRFIDQEIAPLLSKRSIEIIDIFSENPAMMNKNSAHQMVFFHKEDLHPSALDSFCSLKKISSFERQYDIHRFGIGLLSRFRKTLKNLARCVKRKIREQPLANPSPNC